MLQNVRKAQTPKIFTCCAVSPGAPIAFCGTGDNKLLLANLSDKTLGAAVELPKVCREVQCSPAAPGAAGGFRRRPLLLPKTSPQCALHRRRRD